MFKKLKMKLKSKPRSEFKHYDSSISAQQIYLNHYRPETRQRVPSPSLPNQRPQSILSYCPKITSSCFQVKRPKTKSNYVHSSLDTIAHNIVKYK